MRLLGWWRQAVQDLKKMLPTLNEHLIEHLDYEELYVNHVPKKYFNPKITRKLVPSPPPRPHHLDSQLTLF